MERHQAFGDKTADLLKDLGLQGPLPPDRTAAILRMSASAAELSQKEAAKHDELAQQLRAGLLAMVEAAFQEEQAIAPLLLPVIQAARKELGEEIDMTVYRRVLDRSKPEDRDTLAKLFGASTPTSA